MMIQIAKLNIIKRLIAGYNEACRAGYLYDGEKEAMDDILKDETLRASLPILNACLGKLYEMENKLLEEINEYLKLTEEKNTLDKAIRIKAILEEK